MIRIELPIPISSNNAYVNRKPFGATGSRTFRGGRFPSQEHKVWRKAAGYELIAAKPANITGKYTFHIMLPMGMRGDVSNRIKLAEDLLVEHGITPDDSNCVDARASRSEDVPKGRCIVIVEAAP